MITRTVGSPRDSIVLERGLWFQHLLISPALFSITVFAKNVNLYFKRAPQKSTAEVRINEVFNADSS